MAPTGVHTNSLVEWGSAGRAAPGQTVLGDLHFVKSFDHRVLVAVVDGLGHGVEAAAAAERAIALLADNIAQSLASLIQQCHEALLKTRGAVMTIALLDAREGSLACLGVGNVDGLLLRADVRTTPAREPVLLAPGIVGGTLPALRASVFALSPGDLFILTSDGVRGGFDLGLNLSDAPQAIAERIINGHFKGSDDALALVIRFLGSPP